MKKRSSIFDCFKSAKNVLIVSHYHPDGDALGSTLALGQSLKKLGKQVVMYNRDPVPYNLQFLPGVKQITQIFPQGALDVAVMVDCAQPKRVSAEFEKAVEAKKIKTLVCIDHHLLDQPVGDIDWIDPEAAATGVVIWHLLKKLKVPVSKEIANLVYCTLTVDTGSFRYSNTTVDVFKLASELVSQGADPWFVACNLEETNPMARFTLMRASLQSLNVRLGGKFATMDVTQAMLTQSGAGDDLSEDFANIPRSIFGVEVSALFREEKDGKIKVSLRSKSFVDVCKIAKKFGGGGHEHAAGCNFGLSLEEARNLIQDSVEENLKIKNQRSK